jgi:hypothetical protein
MTQLTEIWSGWIPRYIFAISRWSTGFIFVHQTVHFLWWKSSIYIELPELTADLTKDSDLTNPLANIRQYPILLAMKPSHHFIAERYRGITPAPSTRLGYSGDTANGPLVKTESRAGTWGERWLTTETPCPRPPWTPPTGIRTPSHLPVSPHRALNRFYTTIVSLC